MTSEEFEERFRNCREMPGADDPAYRSALNELAGRPDRDDLVLIAIADDERRRWSSIGTSLLDARLAAFSDLYADADPEQRQILSDFFEGDQLHQLEVFVARAARLLEHTEDPQWLRRALAVACMDGGRYDPRDLLAGLYILRYGAERADIDIGPFFREAIEMSPPSGLSPEGWELREILLTVMDDPKESAKYWVRKFGPPEWQNEVKPWWRFWCSVPSFIRNIIPRSWMNRFASAEEEMSFEQQFETEEQRAVFEAGKKLFHEHLLPDEVEIELLVEQRRDREAVEAVMPALIRWRTSELGYITWLKFVMHAPTRNGPLVLFLVGVTAVFTLLAAMLGIGLFPSGNYPEVVLAVPGIIAGFIFFCGAGGVVYLLQRSGRTLLGGRNRLKALPEPDTTSGDKYTPWKES